MLSPGNGWSNTCHSAGNYTLVIRSTSNLGSTVTLYQGKREVSKLILPNTGGWNKWQSTEFSDIYLAGGEDQILRFEINTSTVLLHYAELIRQANVADINRSGRVDMEDFALLAAQWLAAPKSPSADIAPPGGDGLVDFLDLIELFNNWLND